MKQKNIGSDRVAHGVGEWAQYSINIQHGCSSDCKYCYAKAMAVRFKRATPESWKQPAIRTAAVAKGYGKRNGRIMFPTSHDITSDNLTDCRTTLRKLATSGNDILIVTKADPRCVKAICSDLRDYMEQVSWRFTIGSVNPRTLKYWEPNAPSLKQRLKALREAYSCGYVTSVSCEPMLDTDPASVIEATKPYVTDAIWLGRVNRLGQTISVNCPNDATARRRANSLLASQTDDFLRDLYDRYKDDPKIKFKDSIKKVVGLERPVVCGLDI